MKKSNIAHAQKSAANDSLFVSWCCGGRANGSAASDRSTHSYDRDTTIMRAFSSRSLYWRGSTRSPRLSYLRAYLYGTVTGIVRTLSPI